MRLCAEATSSQPLTIVEDTPPLPCTVKVARDAMPCTTYSIMCARTLRQSTNQLLHHFRVHMVRGRGARRPWIHKLGARHATVIGHAHTRAQSAQRQHEDLYIQEEQASASQSLTWPTCACITIRTCLLMTSSMVAAPLPTEEEQALDLSQWWPTCPCKTRDPPPHIHFTASQIITSLPPPPTHTHTHKKDEEEERKNN